MALILQDFLITILQTLTVSIVAIYSICIKYPFAFAASFTGIQSFIYIFLKYALGFPQQVISPILMIIALATLLLFTCNKRIYTIVFYFSYIFYLVLVEMAYGTVLHLILDRNGQEAVLQLEPYVLCFKLLFFLANIPAAVLFLLTWRKLTNRKYTVWIQKLPLYWGAPFFISQLGVLMILANYLVSAQTHLPNNWVPILLAILCFLISTLSFFYTVRRYINIRLKEKDREILYRSAQSQLHLLEQMVIQEKELSKFHHDLNNQLQTIYSLLLHKEFEKSIAYIREVVSISQVLQREVYCSNDTVNAILNQKTAMCQEYGIRFDPTVCVKEDFFMPPMHLCSLFGNVLDNAINACRELVSSGKEAYIILRAWQHGKFFLISCTNSFQQAKKGQEQKRLHWGLDILSELAEMYQGDLKSYQTEQGYTIQLSLALDAIEEMEGPLWE